jgi:FkbM family methyltransferase
MIRASHFQSMCRLCLGSARQLDNWGELLAATLHEIRGQSPTDAKVLHFRDGLEIGLVPGGMGGFYILFREIFCERAYEPVPAFRPVADSTVVDVGANMGVFTCRAAKLAPRGRVIAVEPLSCYTKVLKRNIARNRMENVSVWPAALASRPGKASLSFWYTATGEPKSTPGAPLHARRAVEHVNAVTLQQIFEREQIARCDLLKMDIEGGEYQALLAAPRRLLDKVQRIAMEWHQVPGHHPQELFRFIEESGLAILPSSDQDWGKDAGMLYAARN